MTVSATGDFHGGVGACSLEGTIMALTMHQSISRGGGRCHFGILHVENSSRKGTDGHVRKYVPPAFSAFSELSTSSHVGEPVWAARS